MLFPLIQVVISISGVWNTWGYSSGNWAELAPLLSSNGYDAVFFCAAYGLNTDTLGLQECIDACNEYGIDVHAWIVMWRTAKSTEQERESFREQGRLQVSLDDLAEAQLWLCPTDPANVADMAEVCLRIAADYDVRGIHLDYIRYCNNRVCYCEQCRERFVEETGVQTSGWPTDYAMDGRFYDEYNRWRSQAITTAVRAVRDSLSKLNKVVELSAAVLPREVDMNNCAQQWDEWLGDGLVDFVVPMNYTLSDSELVFWGEAQLRLAEMNQIPCGLITYRNNSQFSISEINAQQEKVLEMGFDGWVMFYLSNHFISLLEENQEANDSLQ